MNSILEIQEKKDSERKLQQVENLPKEYVLFANEINIIVKTIIDLMNRNSLDEVLEVSGYSERSATVGDLKAKSFQIGDNFIPDSSGAIFRIQRNSDGTISVILDSVSHTDSDNFGRLTATISNDGGVIFRHLANDNNEGVIAKIRKDGILFSLINSFLKVDKDGVARDILLAGLAQINDIDGLELALNNKADLEDGKLPKAQSQPSTMNMNSSTYVITFTDATGAVQTIDLPLETLFKDANYDSSTKTLTLTLGNGNTRIIPLTDLVDLPEIVLATTNPATNPTSGQKVYFNTSSGKVWFNNGTLWNYSGNLVTDTEKANYNFAYEHSKKEANPHQTKLVELKDFDSTILNIIGIDSFLLIQNSAGLFSRIPWDVARSLIPTPPLNDFNIRRKGITIYDDMLSTTASDYFTKGTFNSGTWTISSLSSADNPGILVVSSTASATNGGGNIIPANTGTPRNFAFNVGSSVNLVFKTASLAASLNMRFGLISGTVNPAQPTDAVYFTLTNNSLIGQTASNSVRSSTAAFTSITPDTFYHCRLIVTSSNLITYELYNMNGSLIWSDTLNTNVPTIGTGVQPTFICYNTVAEDRQLMFVDIISYTPGPMNRGALT